MDVAGGGVGSGEPLIISRWGTPEDAHLDVRVAVGMPARHRPTDDSSHRIRIGGVGLRDGAAVRKSPSAGVIHRGLWWAAGILHGQTFPLICSHRWATRSIRVDAARRIGSE